MQTHAIVERAMWDAEAGVFVATSEDVPGLVAEAQDLPGLLGKLDVLIPELLELNGDQQLGSLGQGFRETPVFVMAEQEAWQG